MLPSQNERLDLNPTNIRFKPVTEKLNFVLEASKPSINYWIRKGERICLKVSNHDLLALERIQVKVPISYRCLVDLDYQIKPRGIAFVLDKGSKTYTIELATLKKENTVESISFLFLPKKSERWFMSLTYLSLHFAFDIKR